MIELTSNLINLCPCGSHQLYPHCCQPFHLNAATAESVEQLMRSRYCAFVVGEFDYLMTTHHPQHRQGMTVEQLAQHNTHWLGLQVLNCKQKEESGEVIFKAWYLEDKKIDAIYECSNFVLLNGIWLYTSGKQMHTSLPGRNEPCICNSGKKFKQCCAKKMG
ncbi:YchJ family protein [Shewanella sp. A14]